MARKPVILATISLITLLAAACNDHDLGTTCFITDGGGLDSSSDTEENITLTNEVVSQNLSYDCASFICIATKGSGGYCSQKCRNDAGCPEGFTCRHVQQVGNFANTKFCTFKECKTVADCGNEEEFVCQAVSGVIPNEEIHLCQFKKRK